jgi:hypothetical protein
MLVACSNTACTLYCDGRSVVIFASSCDKRVEVVITDSESGRPTREIVLVDGDFAFGFGSLFVDL